MFDESFDEFFDEPCIAYLIYYNEEWYYYDDEYPEEGVVGPFNNSLETMVHAIQCEYLVAGLAYWWCD